MLVGVASHGATGHIYPLLGFADVLLAAGHHVIILTGSNLVPWLTDLGYTAGAVGESIGWGAAQVQSRYPELTTSLPAEQAWRFDAELFADALPRAMAPALVTAFESRRPDLVLYESTNLGAALAAAELSIQAVCLDLWAVGRWHVKSVELEQRVRAVWAERSALPLTLDPLLGRAHLDPAPASLRIPAAAEGDSIRLPTRQIAWGDPRTSLTPWLTSHHSRPTVYLTLGTVGWGTVDLIRDALAGLTELQVDVLMAIGSYFDPNQLGPLPDSVRVERFVRQDLVLPQVDLAVHHGGSGTLLAAAAEGVPQLVMPLGADQFQNADALAGSGAGLALPQGSVTAAAVRDGVRQLMDDPSHREAANRIRGEILALPTPAERIDDLIALLT
jgi:Erythromycin biosynthesis protein CIII-like, C-terminal domain/Erythromycin biosynthesis protein CIII-like, N-terminal domain